MFPLSSGWFGFEEEKLFDRDRYLYEEKKTIS